MNTHLNASQRHTDNTSASVEVLMRVNEMHLISSAKPGLTLLFFIEVVRLFLLFPHAFKVMGSGLVFSLVQSFLTLRFVLLFWVQGLLQTTSSLMTLISK